MKKLLLLFCLFEAIVCRSQEIDTATSYQHLYVKDEQFIFDKTYMMPNMSIAEIDSMLIIKLPQIPHLSHLLKDGESMKGLIADANVDLDQCGTTNISKFMSSPISADVLISIKEGKYRVTISSVYFNIAQPGLDNSIYPATTAFIDFKTYEFMITKKLINSGRCLENYFNDMFTIKATDLLK